MPQRAGLLDHGGCEYPGAGIAATSRGVRMASSPAAVKSLAVRASWWGSPLCQIQGISTMGCRHGWILRHQRGMVNWDKISASKGVPQPPVPVPPPPASSSPPPAAHAPGTPPLATAATLSEEEARAKLEELLSEPYLAVQRRLEMANLIIGFEQVMRFAHALLQSQPRNGPQHTSRLSFHPFPPSSPPHPFSFSSSPPPLYLHHHPFPSKSD